MLGSDYNVKLPIHYSGKFKGSYAYLTIKDRLPVILVKVIDTICQDKNSVGNSYGEVGKEDVKKVIGRLSALQNEMVTNKPIKPLVSDDLDVKLWNDYLEEENSKHDFPAAWFESSWLYVECYLYRRIKEAFELSCVLKDYDPFYKQKLETLLTSLDDAEKISNALNQTIYNLQNSKDSLELHNAFVSYLELSLWGNKCDLSMSAGKENVRQIIETDELKSKILINDAEKVWNLLKGANKTSSHVHIHYVLDNAGFELFCDFCLLHFLTATRLANSVSIYVKRIPWFVSDTLVKDIDCLLETMLNSNQDVLKNISKQWRSNISSGVWTVENELFWTLPHDYSEMSSVDPKLYAKLSQGNLIIFKGDLNYRKLTGDRQWDETTSFITALNKFLPTSLVTLRTIKADVVVGLDPGACERLNNSSLNWRFSGEYALIQFAQKEK